MKFIEKSSNKIISKALAMGLIVSNVLPLIDTEERVEAQPNDLETQMQKSGTKYVKVTCSSLNVRSGSSTKYKKVGTVTRGTTLKYISTSSNGWYQVEYNGMPTFVSNQYSTLTSGSSENNNSTSNNNTVNNDIVKNVGKVTCKSLNVRTGAGTNYSIKATIKRGDVIGILNTYSSGWSKVKLSNTSTGYVSNKYLSITQGNSNNIQVSTPGNSTSTNTPTNSNEKLKTVISTLKAQVGKPYVYGASGPNSFDCSGLTYYSYKQVGIYLNRSSRAQASNGTYVSKSDLRAGDLVFFNSGTNTIRHVGMYVGDGQFIHSPSPGKGVKYENINSSYYQRGYVTARRIIE